MGQNQGSKNESRFAVLTRLLKARGDLGTSGLAGETGKRIRTRADMARSKAQIRKKRAIDAAMKVDDWMLVSELVNKPESDWMDAVVRPQVVKPKVKLKPKVKPMPRRARAKVERRPAQPAKPTPAPPLPPVEATIEEQCRTTFLFENLSRMSGRYVFQRWRPGGLSFEVLDTNERRWLWKPVLPFPPGWCRGPLFPEEALQSEPELSVTMVRQNPKPVNDGGQWVWDHGFANWMTLLVIPKMPMSVGRYTPGPVGRVAAGLARETLVAASENVRWKLDLRGGMSIWAWDIWMEPI